MLDAAQLWSMYQAAAESNGLATDVLTNGAIHVVSDSVAQATERTSLVARAPSTRGPDLARVGRFGAFGAADGAVSHGWFFALDAVVGESGTVAETLLKVAADQLVYTPLFCVWFLAAFVVLEGRDVRTIPRVLRTEWLELFRGNVGFFLPLTGIIYGYVPRDERVLAFGAGSLVYTWILSLWNSARDAERVAAGVELCSVSEADCEPLPAPARSRPLLSIGVRRVLVQATRRSTRRTRTDRPTMRLASDEADAPGKRRLEQWSRLDDGRFRGEHDGRTLWVRAASVEEVAGRPARVTTASGEMVALGTRLEGPQPPVAPSRRSGGPPAAPTLHQIAVRPQPAWQRGLSFAVSTWPTLAVFVTLYLSNAYGVVPGTCIGPAATKVAPPALVRSAELAAGEVSGADAQAQTQRW